MEGWRLRATGEMNRNYASSLGSVKIRLGKRASNLFRGVVSAMGHERVRPRGRMRPVAVHERAVDVQ